MRRIKPLPTRYGALSKRSILGIGLIMVAFAGVGTTLLLRSKAATFAAVQEAESGDVTGNLAKLSGTNATGASNQAVKFGASTVPSPTPPPSGAAYIIAAAGDIAADLGESKTSDIIMGDASIQSVLALGDNAYDKGTLSDYNNKYNPTWGRFKAKTYPTPGNHEGSDGDGGTGYFAYFKNIKPYYSLNLGSWHIISLNVNTEDYGSGSAQVKWLQSDLAANASAKCTLAFWHNPRFTAGTHTDDTSINSLWNVLYPAKVDVVLNGHSHTYERFAKSKPDGTKDAVNGIREFVVGTGGAQLGNNSGSSDATREFDDGNDFGIIKMTLNSDSYAWQFIKPGGAVVDSGTEACH